MRPYVFPQMLKLPKLVKVFDQGSILMVVYGAFSGAVVAGLWHQVSGMTLLLLIIACSVLLTLVMWLAWVVPQWLGLHVKTNCRIFCSSKNLSQWCADGANFIYWAAVGDDCFTDHDFPSNSVNGMRCDSQLS